MAITVTASDVMALIKTRLDLDAVSVFLSDASSFIAERLGSTDPPTSDARQNLITKYLTAHLIAMTVEPHHRIRAMAKGQVYRKEQGEKLDLGLNNTTWGQMVLFFDSTGLLASDNMEEKFGKLFDVYGVTQ